MRMVRLSEVLRESRDPIRVEDPESAPLISVKLYGKGAVRRTVGEGKSPKPFTGNRGRAGQLVYSRIWCRRGAIALIPQDLDGVVVTNEFPIFDIDENQVDARYLIRYLVSPRFVAMLEGASRGASGQNRVRESEFLRLEVPLPPLPEQRRVAAILDEADALLSAVARQRDLMRMAIDATFERLIGNSEGWQKARLADLGAIQGGLTVNVKRAANPIELPYLRVANVMRGGVDISELKTIRVTSAEKSRVGLKRGDLLVVEGHGNVNEVGRVAQWTSGEVELVHQNHLIRIRPDGEKISPSYLEQYLNTAGRRYFREVAKTTSGLNTINITNVKECPVIVPPTAIQREFGEAVGECRQQLVGAARREGELRALFASLQHRAFRGEL